ncbi:MAG: DEAD/DEAH box helicase [Rhodoferax sp.]|uniref:DEAD/DEAH box helicase n=1 Tax=Rhodoferax sp. TaxID=50421 RepID=UPI002609A3AE|nr:DEAD/DEAH box helicase [Rhodoferax sp.]MDD5332324.1 DEAD/DEAH box helicase [Rhodoferax sp.]
MSTARKRKTAPKKTKTAKPTEPRLSRLRRPPELAVTDWQTALRRQFGREQSFGLENLGSEPVFSDFRVSNPDSGTRYRVAIRGPALGQNFCTCPDYATNDLGTCKHIEFTLAKLQARRGGKAALQHGFQPTYSEIWLDYAGQRRVRFSAGTTCPGTLLKQAELLFDSSAGWALPWERQDQLESLLQAAQDCHHELRCYDDVWQFIAQIRDGERRYAALVAAYPKGIRDKALKRLLKVKLYPYQVEGALFAARTGRCLIGDEMGLGKTIQAIAAAELFARHFGVRRVLVVCPTSLKHQWKNEFAHFAEREVQVIHGLRAQRQNQYREEVFCKITHYETLARDADLIAAWAPDLVIADEAQRIKNWNTIAARALKRIKSPYAMVLTGTPLENRLEELISIVQFVDQHRLGPTWRLLDEHQMRDEAGRVIGYRALDRIGQTLAPVMLRRRKAEVLTQLPERVDNRVFVPLTPQQRVHHDENGQIVTRIVLRWRKTGYLSDVDQRRLRCALQNMRMACNSTFLLDHESDHGHKVDELMTLLDELFEDPCAKAVVFSQWLGTHELIRRRLAMRTPTLATACAALPPEGALAPRGGPSALTRQMRPWGHVLFSGSISGDKRGALVEQFHNDPDCRLFLSTDAGGVGLNLQHAAAVLVNMDLPWNPAVLEQRIGRVHRMGQSRGVQVINFVGQGSIEEGILSVLAFKKSLFAGVLDGGEVDVFMQGTRLSQFMKRVEQVAGAMGEDEGDAQPNPGVDVQPPAVAESMDRSTAASDATASVAPTGPEATAAVTEPAPSPVAAADPWAAILEAGAALLQGLAAARGAAGTGAAPPAIERDPVTGQASIRLPLPDPAVLQRLAKAFEPWLK